jgi:hypothetical protein
MMRNFFEAAKKNPKTTVSALVLAGMAIHGVVHDWTVITSETWWMKVVGAFVAFAAADGQGDDSKEDLGTHFGFPMPTSKDEE